MTVFTISEYFIGHTLVQAVSYILKRQGNSLEEPGLAAWLPGSSESEFQELIQRSGMSGMSELSEGDNSLIYRHHHPINKLVLIVNII